MQRRLGIALFLLAGCGGIPDIPPIAISGDGVRLMDSSKTPFELYDTTYSKLTPLHHHVRIALNAQGMKNTSGAATSLNDIAANLQTMQDLLLEPDKGGLTPYIAKYKELAGDVLRGMYGANWQPKLDTWEIEIKVRYTPSKAPVIAAWPTKPQPTADPAKPTPTATPTGTPIVNPPIVKDPSPVNYRLAFKAWKQSHTELVEKFGAGKDCGAAYKDTLEALTLMKTGLEATRHAKINLMTSVYEQQHSESKGYTVIPQGSSKDMIIRQLGIIAESLESEYNPDKK